MTIRENCPANLFTMLLVSCFRSVINNVVTLTCLLLKTMKKKAKILKPGVSCHRVLVHWHNRNVAVDSAWKGNSSDLLSHPILYILL